MTDGAKKTTKSNEKKFDVFVFLSKGLVAPVEFAAGTAEIVAEGLREATNHVNKDNLFAFNPYKNGVVVGAKEGLNKTFDGVSGVVDKTFETLTEAFEG